MEIEMRSSATSSNGVQISRDYAQFLYRRAVATICDRRKDFAQPERRHSVRYTQERHSELDSQLAMLEAQIIFLKERIQELEER